MVDRTRRKIESERRADNGQDGEVEITWEKNGTKTNDLPRDGRKNVDMVECARAKRKWKDEASRRGIRGLIGVRLEGDCGKRWSGRSM